MHAAVNLKNKTKQSHLSGNCPTALISSSLFFSYTKLKARLLVLNVIKALGLNENSQLFHSLFGLTFVCETKRMIEFKASMARTGHRASRTGQFLTLC